MKKTKIYTLIFISIFLIGLAISALSINFAHAIDVVFIQQTSQNDGADFRLLHPSNTNDPSAEGETFVTNGSDTTLTGISVMMEKVGSPVGTLTMKLYAPVTGTYGTDMRPSDSSVLATATNTLDVSTLTGSFVWTNFTFNNFHMTANTMYSFALTVTAVTTMDVSNRPVMGTQASNVYSGNWIYYTAYTGASWKGANDRDVTFKIFISSTPYSPPTPTPTPTFSYSYDISKASDGTSVSYYFAPNDTQASLIQSETYNYIGTVLNSSVPYVNGYYYVYKTALYKGNLDSPASLPQNATDDLNNDAVTLIENASFTAGIFLFDFTPTFWLNSTVTYQGLKVNGTITGSNETFSSRVILAASEPSYQFVGELTGDNLNHAAISYFPTEIALRQDTPYQFNGYIYVGAIQNGTGNFTLYSTGLSSLYNIALIGTYNQVATGNITNGTFTFTFGARSGPNTLLEGYRVRITLDSGIDANYTYNLGWFRPGQSGPIDIDNDQGVPYPLQTFAPFPSSPTDTTGISGTMTTIINFIILFLIIGLPVVILGAVAGVPGLIVGAIFGLGIGVIAGLIPFWFIFLIGAGTVTAFLMWNRNKAAGQ